MDRSTAAVNELGADADRLNEEPAHTRLGPGTDARPRWTAGPSAGTVCPDVASLSGPHPQQIPAERDVWLAHEPRAPLTVVLGYLARRQTAELAQSALGHADK